MSSFGGRKRLSGAKITATEYLSVLRSDSSKVFDANVSSNTIILGAQETNIADPMLMINSQSMTGDAGYIFTYPKIGGGSAIGGLYREKSTSGFALIQDAQMSGVNNINLSTASLGDLNIGKLYSNTHILVGSDNSTCSIDITGGVLKLSASGIGNGFLTYDASGNLSTEVLSGLDVPLSANLVAVGNSSNKMSSSSSLEIQNGKVGIGVYPSEPSSALQVIGGINTDSISGSSENFTNSTITNLNTTSITGSQ